MADAMIAVHGSDGGDTKNLKLFFAVRLGMRPYVTSTLKESFLPIIVHVKQVTSETLHSYA